MAVAVMAVAVDDHRGSQMTVAVMRIKLAVMSVAVDGCCSDDCHDVSYEDLCLLPQPTN